MPTIPRLRKICYLERAVDYCSSFGFQSYDPPAAEADITDKVLGNKIKKGRISNARNVDRKTKFWRRVDSYCWVIGCMCTLWWVLVFLYHCLPVNMFPGFRVPETPGARMAAEGARVLHPVVLVPGIVTGGLEIWEGKPCAEGLIRKRLWGGSFTEIIKRSAFNLVIENLAKIGYEEKNLYMAAYDWRLSFQNTEIRDQTLSRLKNTIELMFNANGCKKMVVVPHSTGAICFLHFLKWVETPTPMGGGGGSDGARSTLKRSL